MCSNFIFYKLWLTIPAVVAEWFKSSLSSRVAPEDQGLNPARGMDELSNVKIDNYSPAIIVVLLPTAYNIDCPEPEMAKIKLNVTKNLHFSIVYLLDYVHLPQSYIYIDGS